MARTAGIGFVTTCAVLLGGAHASVAAPHDLASLGATIDLPAGWSVRAGGLPDSVSDTLTQGEIRVLLVRKGWPCGKVALATIPLLARERGTFVAVPAWVPAGWHPAMAVSTSFDERSLTLCRDLDPSAGGIGVFVTLPAAADPARALGGLLAAIEAALARQGVAAADYGPDTAAAIAQMNQQVNEHAVARGVGNAKPGGDPPPVSIESPPAPVEVESAPIADRTTSYVRARRDADADADASPPPARYDGIRLMLEVGAVSVEGDAVDDGRQLGAALVVPPRYRRGRRAAGLVYGGRLAAGTIGAQAVGHAHVALGGAIGEPRSQVAVLMVLGADRLVTGSLLTSGGATFAGLQGLLRLPLFPRTDVEASATFVAGSQGREAWLELAVVSVRFAGISLLAGVERRTWEDGMSMLGVRLGAGY